MPASNSIVTPLDLPVARGNRSHDLVVIAASAGGHQALATILSALPPTFPVPIAIVLHRTTKKPNLMAQVLGRHTRLRVKIAERFENLRPGTVYLAPPDLHLTVRPDFSVDLIDGRRIRHLLSSANPLFSSAAKALKGRVVAVVLTGSGTDATDGVQDIRASGGVVLAQDKATSQVFSMPASAIATGCVDCVLPLPKIAPALVELVQSAPRRRSAELPAAPG